MEAASENKTDPISPNPAEDFESPEALAQHETLTVAEKLQLLRHWRFDATAKEVASDENMGGDQPSMLGRVGRAMTALGGDPLDDDVHP